MSTTANAPASGCSAGRWAGLTPVGRSSTDTIRGLPATDTVTTTAAATRAPRTRGPTQAQAYPPVG